MGCAIDTANAEWRRIKKYRFDAVLLFDASRNLHVRNGSKADIASGPRDVRFTSKSGHCRAALGCPLCAKSRHAGYFGSSSLAAQRIAGSVKARLRLDPDLASVHFNPARADGPGADNQCGEWVWY
jgi:hypothetical protein